MKKLKPLKYCHVFGGIRNLNFHGWLNEITIERLRNEGCKVKGTTETKPVS